MADLVDLPGEAPPSADPLIQLRTAFDALTSSGSAQYQLRGRWFGSTCGNNFYSWSEYRFGEVGTYSSELAFFENRRNRYWFTTRSHWKETDDGWVPVSPSAVIEESGWLHGWTDPIPRFEHVLDFANPQSFEITESEGATRFKTIDVPILGEWLVREFEATVDNETNTITSFGWTPTTRIGSVLQTRRCQKRTVRGRTAGAGFDSSRTLSL